jgi:hypothetical protein
MKRAFDDVTLQEAVAEQGLRVRADVVRRVKLTIDVVQRDLEVASLDPNDGAGLDRRSVGHGHPVFGFRHRLIHRA